MASDSIWMRIKGTYNTFCRVLDEDKDFRALRVRAIFYGLRTNQNVMIARALAPDRGAQKSRQFPWKLNITAWAPHGGSFK